MLTEVELATLRVIRTLRVDGRYVSACQTGTTARVVISSIPDVWSLPAPGGPEDLRAAIEGARVSSWLPSATLKRRGRPPPQRSRLVGCRDVRRPATFAGLDTLSVLTVDLDRGLPAVDVDSIMTTGDTVYASQSSLYVATHRWLQPGAEAPGESVTSIHRFDASKAGETEYRGSGAVRGFLLSQWAMSEHEGFLRVASTSEPSWTTGDSESYVTVLDERLAQVGLVGGLGRGERIFAVRFIGTTGFVVTFRQTDPLYTLDLEAPTSPRVLGELKILGYSAYLHPVGDDLLLGVGQDATAQGRLQGAQLSLFDVSDLRNPRLLQRRPLGFLTASEVEWDHHAFLYWPDTSMVVLPVSDWERFDGAVGFRVDRARGIAEVGRVAHDEAAVRRSLVIGERLYTVSERGVRASELATLRDLAWVPF